MGCNWGLTPSKYSVVGVPSQYAPSPTISFHIFPFILKNLVSLGQTMLQECRPRHTAQTQPL